MRSSPAAKPLIAVSLRRSLRATLTAGLLGLTLLPSSGTAQATLATIRQLSPGELRTDGFMLDRDGVVRIDATGAEPQDGLSWIERTFTGSSSRERAPWQGNAWILNARTRAVVWELREAGDLAGRRPLRKFEGDVRLPAGLYEVHYASYPDGWSSNTQGNHGWFNIRDRVRNLTDNFGIAVAGVGRRATRQELAQARTDVSKEAFISLTNVHASTVTRAGFSIDKPTEIDVYAIGEATQGGASDYAWIVNADTRRKVWELRYSQSDPAGGSAKNRVDRRTLTLEPGRYGVTMVSDDSHDPDEWNAAPPFDPSFYGVTLRAHNAADAARVKLFAYDPTPTGKAIVDLTRVGDSESRQAGFTLTKPMDVRVYALGEGTGNRMNDYGWIADATTHRRVWQMDYDETEHAGGAQKNRLTDRVVHLDRGSYLVYYVSDGSHSYDEWNSAQPMDPDHWGISVYAANESERSAVAAYEEKKDASVLAEIVRVRDDRHERARFTLDKDADIRVYALGEGSRSEMNDYAWIEDVDSGRTVWRMRYDDTENAGGAAKNRQVTEVLHLRAGTYVVHYRTDDSHSYGDWNDDPPGDPAHWGVTIYRVPAK